MTKNKRFQIYGDMVEDTLGIIPVTVWPSKEQQQKYCDEMNKLHEESEQLKKKTKNEIPKPNKRLRHIEVLGDKTKSFEGYE